MVLYSEDQRWWIYQQMTSGLGIPSLRMRFRTTFGRPVSKGAVYRIFKEVQERQGAHNILKGNVGRKKRSRTLVRRVATSSASNPRLSTRKRAQLLRTSPSTTRAILKQDLKKKPYRCIPVQKLVPSDYPKRVAFARWYLQMLAQDPTFEDYVLFSDESHVQLGCGSNRQNNRCWSSSPPSSFVTQKSHHPQKVTIWCAISVATGLIGPYFFEDTNGNTVTVRATRYLKLIQDVYRQHILLLPQGVQQKLWWQQDAATPHTADISINWVRTTFGNQTLGRRLAVEFPPRSPDLTACDYWLWADIKRRVHEQRPSTLSALKASVTAAALAIPRAHIDNAMRDLRRRCQECIAAGGTHFVR